MKQTILHSLAMKDAHTGVKNGFTIIELLVSISILAALSIVAYTSFSGHIKSVNNATRISSIDSLHLSLSDYLQIKKILPEPSSNYIIYDDRGVYAHSLSGAATALSSGSYGVSGHVTNDFLPAGYINFGLADPENAQFYGYGKTLDPKTPKFDLAATLYDDTTGGYKTYLKGTYQGQKLASLIRSYSSSNFVSQNSVDELPYNPYERRINAFVSSLSGTLSIKYSLGTMLVLTGSISTPFSFTGELASGDTVLLSTGSTALLHISDGSELSIGSLNTQTELELSSLVYSSDNTFATKVKLYLKSGEVWTEAPHLRSELDSRSDFSIQTDSAVAAVRGTVFGMTKTSTGVTIIDLKEGKLEVQRIASGALTSFAMSDGFTYLGSSMTNGAVMNFIYDNTSPPSAKTYMFVPDGGVPVSLNNISNAILYSQTGTISVGDIEKKIYHPPFSFGYRPMADTIRFADSSTGSTNTGTLMVKFNNPGADSYELYFGTGITDSNLVLNKPDLLHPSLTGALSGTGLLTITGSFNYIPSPTKIWTYSLRVCLHGVCSATDIQHLAGNNFSYGPFHVWGDTKKLAQASLSGSFTPLCPANPTMPGFWSSSCLVASTNSGLVAYAHYDIPGDLNMYASGALLGLPLLSGAIIGNTSTLTFTSGVLSYNTGTSFVSMSGGTKGVFIDHDLNDDYLKYNLSPLSLGTNFGIEMSVRGAALKRASGEYYLFNTIINTAPSEIYLSLKNGNLILGHYNGSLWPKATIHYTSILGAGLVDDDFYKVVAEFNGIAWTLKIPEKSLLGTGNGPLNTGTSTYIGAIKGGLNYQWDDIIDSVKIYKP